MRQRLFHHKSSAKIPSRDRIWSFSHQSGHPPSLGSSLLGFDVIRRVNGSVRCQNLRFCRYFPHNSILFLRGRKNSTKKISSPPTISSVSCPQEVAFANHLSLRAVITPPLTRRRSGANLGRVIYSALSTYTTTQIWVRIPLSLSSPTFVDESGQAITALATKNGEDNAPAEESDSWEIWNEVSQSLPTFQTHRHVSRTRRARSRQTVPSLPQSSLLFLLL